MAAEVRPADPTRGAGGRLQRDRSIDAAPLSGGPEVPPGAPRRGRTVRRRPASRRDPGGALGGGFRDRERHPPLRRVPWVRLTKRQKKSCIHGVIAGYSK